MEIISADKKLQAMHRAAQFAQTPNDALFPDSFEVISDSAFLTAIEISVAPPKEEDPMEYDRRVYREAGERLSVYAASFAAVVHILETRGRHTNPEINKLLLMSVPRILNGLVVPEDTWKALVKKLNYQRRCQGDFNSVPKMAASGLVGLANYLDQYMRNKPGSGQCFSSVNIATSWDTKQLDAFFLEACP